MVWRRDQALATPLADSLRTVHPTDITRPKCCQKQHPYLHNAPSGTIRCSHPAALTNSGALYLSFNARCCTYATHMLLTHSRHYQ